MKIYFERYTYDLPLVSANLNETLYTQLKNDKVQILDVGYYYSPQAQDSVFILPKVFIDKDGKAFSRYAPEDIIDISPEDNPLKAHGDDRVVFELSAWLYRAIARYNTRHPFNGITTDADIQNVVSINGNSTETFLDVILALLKFNKENRSLFTQISIINSSGNNKIHWGKTISKTQPIIQGGSPYYTEFRNKQKTVNFDEEIIVLFYSVLDYLKKTYHFNVVRSVGYTLIPHHKIEAMIQTGKGTRTLKNIRKKYFTDKLVALWRLLYTFFDKAESVANKRYNSEFLLSKNFNIIFEDMVDSLIGDTENLPSGLKSQKDGKEIDHIYLDHSLIDSRSDIYFIGDSKYYSESSELGTNSIYKQFTYAKNVIQFNVDIFNRKQQLDPIRYRDNLTEGYNITPNFFIKGIVNHGDINYSDLGLEAQKDSEKLPTNKHFTNRLFDRDTLILQTYNVNFLFVLSAYVANTQNSPYKQKIRSTFREDLVRVFNTKYEFYKVTPNPNPESEDVLKDFVDTNFRQLNGKIYRASEEDNFLWLALEKNEELVKIELLKLISTQATYTISLL